MCMGYPYAYAEQVGYHPLGVMGGRSINDGMGRWLAD